MVDLSKLPQRKSFLGRILRFPLDLIPKNAVVPIMQGVLRGKRWIVGASLHSYWLGSYESHKQNLMAQHMKPGDIVYDIGANVGFYTIFAAHLVKDTGHVYAFEPFPKAATFAQKHVALNGFHNVTFFQMAIANYSGVARFQEAELNAMGRLTTEGSLEVLVTSIDTLVAEKNLSPATIIKIDVEGAELVVLRGASGKN